jgi:hypothetical protein
VRYTYYLYNLCYTNLNHICYKNIVSIVEVLPCLVRNIYMCVYVYVCECECVCVCVCVCMCRYTGMCMQACVGVYETVWFNFQTYIIFSINLVSQVTFRFSGTDILYGCHLLRCLYNILYFL